MGLRDNHDAMIADRQAIDPAQIRSSRDAEADYRESGFWWKIR